MTWKKLAFTDEMLTNPMAGTLNMAGFLIDNVDDLQADSFLGITHRDSGGADRLATATTTYAFVAHADADMNAKKIDNIGDVQANAAAGIVIREYGGNDIGAMAVSGNNDYTMRLKNTDGNNAVDLAGTTYAMIAHYPINMDQKEIDAMVFENLATAPHAASEVQGEVYYDTVDDHLHVWVV